ncbi:hypothetical protein [Brevibacillus laterosporus]|uniref:hypothetical protein n=1 Tax=Brevibacillus laterosporus TaxID=1465 RepID=UPI003D1D4F8F
MSKTDKELAIELAITYIGSVPNFKKNDGISTYKSLTKEEVVEIVKLFHATIKEME